MTYVTSFQHELDRIARSESTIESSAEELYKLLTEDEKLWLLDGDASVKDFMLSMFTTRYCGVPHEAGVIDRLGIPGIRFSDGPRGILEGTAFPCPSSRACMFDPDIEEQVGVAIGRELRALGGNYFGGVCVNLAPNPKWGRAQESYGEDPLLVGSMGAALSRGAGENVIACAKHFALNSMENGRFTVDVTVAENVLHECYLPHFRQCLEEGRAESLMSAYNSANGEWCGQNRALLNGIVRDTWGYDDVVITSDWVFGMRDAAKSVSAGLDVEMPFRSIRYKHLLKALRQGKASWSDVERLGKRILRFELKYYARIAAAGIKELDVGQVVRCQAHRDLARVSAAKGMVLLKNDRSLLPFSVDKVRHLLVVGSLAASTQTGDQGSSAVRDPDVVSPLKGLKKMKGVEITYLDGTDLPAVERAAARADAVFVLVGFTAQDEGEYVSTMDPQLLSTGFTPVFPHVAVAMAFNWVVGKISPLLNAFLPEGTFVTGGDRRSLRLNPKDEQLASAVADFAGDKLVLGVEASGPVVLPQHVRQGARSILFTGYAGSRFGEALRDVLFGSAEPAGRLAFTIPESELDIPDIDMGAKSVTYDRFWGYRLAQQRRKRPVYPFGFGLGYGQVKLVPHVPAHIGERFFNINVGIKNVGKTHHTSTVVQVYAGKVDSARGDTDYERVLVGFARSADVSVSGSTEVVVGCRLDPVSHWNASRQVFEVAGAKYNIWVSQYEGDDAEASVVDVGAIEWGVKNKQ